MSIGIYLKQQMPKVVVHILGITFLSLFLWNCGNSKDTILMICSIWMSILVISIIVTLVQKKRELDQLINLTEGLEQCFLIGEVMKEPMDAVGQVYYDVLKKAQKSMLEEIGKVQRERKEYKEYIEQWVHEVKTPITAIKLLGESHRDEVPATLFAELEKIDGYIDQALYYARSEYAQKDYFIKEVSLFSMVHQTIATHKNLLRQNQVTFDIMEEDYTVFTDEKWVCFMLGQILVNAVKYKSEKPLIQISSIKEEGYIKLFIKDNGIGISQSDLPQIFEKGFTGENGRIVQTSTGMGLYLCKRLCEKLGIAIEITSKEGTTVCLYFHINDWVMKV